MFSISAQIYLWTASSSHPLPASELATITSSGSDPLLGLLLMALGLLIYTGSLCIRDRWWETRSPSKTAFLE